METPPAPSINPNGRITREATVKSDGRVDQINQKCGEACPLPGESFRSPHGYAVNSAISLPDVRYKYFLSKAEVKQMREKLPEKREDRQPPEVKLQFTNIRLLIK